MFVCLSNAVYVLKTNPEVRGSEPSRGLLLCPQWDEAEESPLGCVVLVPAASPQRENIVFCSLCLHPSPEPKEQHRTRHDTRRGWSLTAETTQRDRYFTSWWLDFTTKRAVR